MRVAGNDSGLALHNRLDTDSVAVADKGNGPSSSRVCSAIVLRTTLAGRRAHTDGVGLKRACREGDKRLIPAILDDGHGTLAVHHAHLQPAGLLFCGSTGTPHNITASLSNKDLHN